MLWMARRMGLTDDDMDYLTDSQLLDLMDVEAWYNSPHESSGPREHVKRMTPADVDDQMG